ncbi:uncharacterized protein LOC142519649 [Primulina tabacum]|uniref:uncharacterized protein LOC142519649 n=1 Tax=Primulina tabacum TaxID=48773 RepID=UPI003F5ABAFD
MEKFLHVSQYALEAFQSHRECKFFSHETCGTCQEQFQPHSTIIHDASWINSSIVLFLGPTISLLDVATFGPSCWMGELTLVTIKLYYNGSMETDCKRKMYKGGSTEYFDFIDMDKIGLIELWGYAEEVGCLEKERFRFWHKMGKSLNNGRYLESDAAVVEIRNHVPKKFEVEIYIEHDEFVSINQIYASGVLEKPKEVEPKTRGKGKNIVIDGDISNDLFERMKGDEGDDDCAESDELESAFDSEEEDPQKFQTYEYLENPDLKLGMTFNSKKEAKFVIESHCIRRGMVVNFVKNDKSRLRGTREFREEVKSTLNVALTYKQAYLGRKKELKLVDGSIAEEFSRIRNYCAELRRSDEGASVILKLTDEDDGPRFQRLYVCFSACKQGFKESCRPVVGVDGCFLKTNSGGQLLTVVDLDLNNNIFPIAYALVEGETKDS